MGHGRTLNLCYGTIKGAYNSFPLTPLGSFDHNCVLLAQVYQPAVKKGKVERNEEALWTESTICELNACLHDTSMQTTSLFKGPCTYLDEMTYTMVSYITFCKEMIIPSKNNPIVPKL